MARTTRKPVAKQRVQPKPDYTYRMTPLQITAFDGCWDIASRQSDVFPWLGKDDDDGGRE